MMDKKRVINPSIDDIGRYSIVEDLDKNLFVIAGAGSGKTSMLVSRMVAMVESGIDISLRRHSVYTRRHAIRVPFVRIPRSQIADQFSVPVYGQLAAAFPSG